MSDSVAHLSADPAPVRSSEPSLAVSALLVAQALSTQALVIVAPFEAKVATALVSLVLAVFWYRRGAMAATHMSLQIALSLLPVLLLARSLPLFVAGVIGALALQVLLTALLPPLREGLDWLKVGRLGKAELLWILAVIPFTSATLLAWFYLAHPNLHDLVAVMPHGGGGLAVAFGLSFALLNALYEELLWRNMMLSAFDRVFGANLWPVVLQAMSFGIAHWNGVPRGSSGVVLAGLYGLVLGLLRRRSQGLVAPYIAHVFADITIVTMLGALAAAG